MRYVLLKGSSHGLANRLFVLSTAIRICKRTGAKLIVDWNDGTYGIPFWDVFSLKGCSSLVAPDQNPQFLNSFESAQTAWQGQYDATVTSVYNQVSRNTQYSGVDLQEIPPISGLKTFFNGQPQKEVLVLCGYQKRGQSPLELLNHLFLTKTWQDMLSANMEIKGNRLEQGTYVGVHIRAASGDSFPRLKRKILLRYLEQHPTLRLFVSTDLLSVEKEMKDLFGERLLSIGRTYATTRSNQSEVEPFALHRISNLQIRESGILLQEALRDLYLLSRSYALFAQPYSTFSELACLFSYAPPWRLRLSGEATLRYRLGNLKRGMLKYAAINRSLVS